MTEPTSPPPVRGTNLRRTTQQPGLTQNKDTAPGQTYDRLTVTVTDPQGLYGQPLRLSYTPDPSIGFDAQAEAYWTNPNFLPENVRDFVNRAADANYGYSTTPQQRAAFWRYVFGQAATNNVSVYDVIRQVNAGASGGADETTGSGGGGGGGPSTLTSYDFTSPRAARDILDASLKVYLGRAATPDEVRAFTASLRAEEQANPTVSTLSGGTRTATGGVDAQSFARDYAMQQEGAAEYQAATRYLDLFLEALG